MWFSRDHFALCDELRIWGLAPRFEPGDVVARGFADLGFEEFQVLPGPALLSLTAGTVTPIPEGKREHFFWIPSVDEAVELLEARGCEFVGLARKDGRAWSCQFRDSLGIDRIAQAKTMHEVILRALYSALSGKEHGKV